MGKTACRRRHGSIAPSVSPPLTAALTSIQDMTSALSLMAAVAALMLVGNVDAKARKYLVETKDDMALEPAWGPVPVDPLPAVPVPVDLENEIADKIAMKLRAAGSDYSGTDYGFFDKLLSVGGKVLPKFGEIIDEVGKELDIPTMSTIGKGISKVATSL